ncbi:TaqI-like C-terminal specificity domain containing protein [Methylophilaceae bacterium]
MPIIITPRKALNKAYLKVKPVRNEIESFKSNLIKLLEQVNHAESEEFNKNVLADFIKNTFYSPNYFINTKGRNDLVIHNNKTASDSVGVIIEAKRSTNASEMIRADNINNKALQELVLYYLRERITHKNLEVKNLIVTNVNEWFIFDANVFEKHFAQNKKLVQQFIDFETGTLSGIKTDFFYKEVASVAIEAVKEHIEYTYFNIADIETALRNSDKGDDTKLIPFYKLLSPQHLLKIPFANDSNSLNKSFYSELLHIIGLEETKEGGKKLIGRKKVGERYSGTLIENAIIQIESESLLSNIPNRKQYGNDKDEQLFNVAIELAITWINRILFLKLLEAQLITYHKNDNTYAFLNTDFIKDFDELNTLFFQVLASKVNDRSGNVKAKFAKVPYLNSSLFERSEIEGYTLRISNLNDSIKIPILSSTVLKNEQGKKQTGELNAIEYLFSFLNAYDFASDGNADIQEDSKTLINASVLGLIFEKINGYKDGSFFTPGFVTMYMSREALRKSVVHKFNENKGLNCKDLRDIYNSNIDANEANAIINSIKICDPAVGSGHFLVSALNEIIAIKAELEVLQDKDGKRLKNYSIEVVNDELIVSDEDGELFEYNPSSPASQRIQETLFNEKQTIIESCLFGVDINPNSVKICRLRLWIELLKNAYYKADGELETLPNIDINIKCGNSLISRFDLGTDLKEALKKSKLTISQYKSAVQSYRAAKSKDEKWEMERLINEVKTGFRTEILYYDPKSRNLEKLRAEVKMLELPQTIFDESAKEKKERADKRKKAQEKLSKLEAEVNEIKSNKIYENAFEWRFEFPEVLDDDGKYIGFDVVIGNPPYIYRNLDITSIRKYYAQNYFCTEGNFDLYKFFIERIKHIVKDYGFGTYIISNTFLSAKSFSKLRYLLINEFDINEIYELGLDVFDEAVVENVILTLQKVKNSKNNSVTIKVDHRKYKSINSPQEHYLIDLRQVYDNENAFNVYLKKDTELLVNKLRENTVQLSSISYCTVGINTGYIKDKLFATEKVDSTYHKVLNGKDIMPYAICWKGDWIKYDKNYVDSFGELGRSLPQEYIFTSEKILVQRTRRGLKRKLVCAYDNGTYYNLNRLSNIVITDNEYNILYVIALLNSKLMDYYFNVVFNEYEVKPLHLSQLPIRKLSKVEQEKYVNLVKVILEKKQDNYDADVVFEESKINELVYELYNLTNEEIDVIKLS